jgi:biopolymer transport protein ExbB
MTMNALLRPVVSLLAVAVFSAPAFAQDDKPSFEEAASKLQRQLAASIEELAKLRAKVAAEKIPMAQDLRELEELLLNVRSDLARTGRALDVRTLDLGNLRSDNERRAGQTAYLANLLADHARSFESRLHIAELHRWRAPLTAARLAHDDPSLGDAGQLAAELAVVEASLDRVHDVLGGARFEGKALDTNGLQKSGAFVLVGPTALFRSADGEIVGSVEQRLGSLEPAVQPFVVEADRQAAAQLVLGTGGELPFDSTLGNAHKVAAIEETWYEHVKKGGPVMWPIGAVAGAALIVVLLKWVSMAFVRRPPRKLVDRLLDAVRTGDEQGAREQAEAIGGPTGAMLRAGSQHFGEPRELVEEVMFEQVLATRLRLNGWLPFVAICATSAPLLGLLGTVTGIMNTFSLMTVFGTGDPKTLSSGISEALVTTEYGLIVAIPSLLLHALLSRRARGIVDEMEQLAVSFLNQMRRVEA